MCIRDRLNPANLATLVLHGISALLVGIIQVVILGIGVVDVYKRQEYNFIIGPKLETELEVFILPRTALLARIQQHWNPLSIEKWAGCKLVYDTQDIRDFYSGLIVGNWSNISVK